MGYAPVIQFERRRLIARRLLDMGIPVDQIAEAAATPGTTALDQMWTRERLIASLKKLNGCDRAFYQQYSIAELQELERATLNHLMGIDGRTPDQLIYSIGGRQSRHQTTRRRQHLAAWGIPA